MKTTIPIITLGMIATQTLSAGSPTHKKTLLDPGVYTEGSTFGDVNGDGLTDFATGKRYWAHNGKDPDAHAPAVLYWYELVRDDQGTRFIPHLLDSDSGVGTQFTTADIDGDGKSDIGIGNNKGLFLFTSKKNIH